MLTLHEMFYEYELNLMATLRGSCYYYCIFRRGNRLGTYDSAWWLRKYFRKENKQSLVCQRELCSGCPGSAESGRPERHCCLPMSQKCQVVYMLLPVGSCDSWSHPIKCVGREKNDSIFAFMSCFLLRAAPTLETAITRHRNWVSPGTQGKTWSSP